MVRTFSCMFRLPVIMIHHVISLTKYRLLTSMNDDFVLNVGLALEGTRGNY